MSQNKFARYFKGLTPALALSMKGYNIQSLFRDSIAGIVVSIVAIPLSIAFAIASGMPPVVGVTTAIVGGGFAALLSGSKYQITGPTAACIPIILLLSLSYGTAGFLGAIFLAGIMLSLMGLLKLGKLINYISLPIVAGFTAGIGIAIFIGQLGDLLGLDYTLIPKDSIDKVFYYISNIGNINISSLVMGIACIIIMIVLGKISRKLPAALITILIAVAVQLIFKFNIDTIGSRFAELKFEMKITAIEYTLLPKLIKPAFSIALLVAIVSLLSAKAADNITKTVHNPNAELVSQGLGNIASSFFGGLPVTGAIARTTYNIRNGGQTPISSIIQVVSLIIISILILPYAVYIPLTSLAAVLIMVCKNMVNVRDLKKIFASTPRDYILYIVSLVLTITYSLVVAVEIGIIIAFFSIGMHYLVSVIRKYAYKPEIKSYERDNKLVIEIIGALNFFTDSRFKFDYSFDKYDNITIDMNKTHDLDLQGYMVIVQLVKKIFECGKTVTVTGNNRCIKYLLKINYCDDKRLDLTDILVEQSMLTFNKDNII